MAKYKQISYGSKGSDVTELQKLLNQTGNYNLAEDGDFGEKTRAAVEDYQRKNGLTVDGIVGDNTWGSITGFKPTPGPATTMGASSGSSGGNAQTSSFNYGDYEASDAVTQAEALLQQHMANKPDEYQSQYGSQIEQLIGQITNRGPFTYDVNADALYQQLTDQYAQQGRMAMMDTMGQAAALTGGYGSSYGQSVGQQAYQQHLQGLTEMVPDLYQMALNQYLQEGEALYDQAALLGAQDEQAYGRHRDSVDDYYAELQQLYAQMADEREFDYSTWADGRDFAYGQYSDDRAYAYQQERDRIADEQWQKEYDEMVRQYNQNYALSKSKSSGGSSVYAGGVEEEDPYETTVNMLLYGGYSSAEMLQVIRTSPLSKDVQEDLIAQYQKPMQKREVKEADRKRRNDNSAYWGSR